MLKKPEEAECCTMARNVRPNSYQNAMESSHTPPHNAVENASACKDLESNAKATRESHDHDHFDEELVFQKVPNRLQRVKPCEPWTSEI